MVNKFSRKIKETFRTFRDWLNHKQIDDQAIDDQSSQKTDASFFELCDKLVSNIVKHNSIRRFRDFEVSETFVLWVNGAYQAVIRKKELDFEKTLRTGLDDAGLKTVGNASWIFEPRKPPNTENFIKIVDDVFLEIRDTAQPSFQPSTFTTAQISLADGSGGMLMQEKYALDAGQTYIIGRKDGEDKFGKNHIVIIDDSRKVSRAHAEIKFEHDRGFYIKSRTNSNVTKVFRRQRPTTTITETKSRCFLQDKDRIELGEAVSLLFETPPPHRRKQSTKVKTRQ